MTESNPNRRFFTDELDPETLELLGTIPSRWGRMTPLCRLLIFEIGRELFSLGLLASSDGRMESSVVCGLVGGTRRGSLRTDLDFIATLRQGPGLASPMLFGYTLANIPLAEAAAQFGLRGPVYALYEQAEPLARAEAEARLLLSQPSAPQMMLACAFDHYREKSEQEVCTVTVTVVRSHAEPDSGLSPLA